MILGLSIIMVEIIINKPTESDLGSAYDRMKNILKG